MIEGLGFIESATANFSREVERNRDKFLTAPTNYFLRV
jgi:hypothetical protein